MKNIFRHLTSLMVAAWAGSLWAVGYLAVPVLFFTQPDRQLAGMLAGRMFTLVFYVGTVCGTSLLLYHAVASGRTALKAAVFWIAAAMLLLTLVILCGIQPEMNDLKLQALPLDVMHSEFAARFDTLHHVSSTIYSIISLLAVALVIKAHPQK